jgi:hypothetical protein
MLKAKRELKDEGGCKNEKRVLNKIQDGGWRCEREWMVDEGGAGQGAKKKRRRAKRRSNKQKEAKKREKGERTEIRIGLESSPYHVLLSGIQETK